MNTNIYNFFSNVNKNEKIPYTLMPHQIASLDYLLQKCYHQKESVLLYHKMGSGKTILSLAFALIVSKTKKTLIVVPNNSIAIMWMQQIDVLLNILPEIDSNIDNIQIKTKTKFIEEIEQYDNSLINKIKLYENYFIIIDEAHNFFGNNTGVNIIKIKRIIDAIFILLTGSPISNTVEPLKDILIIIKNIENFSNKYIVKGKKVYQTYLNEEGKKYAEKELKGYISYYNQESDSIPDFYYIGKKLINYPIVLCPMSETQLYWYNETRKANEENKEMFLKIMLNASFCSLGDSENYVNINDIIGTNKELLPNLNISGNILTGKELIDLNISSKLKYFRDKYITNLQSTKKFIYFSNSRIGSLIIRSVMRANGVSEYKKDVVNNYRCVFCNNEKSCPTKLNKLCKPVKFFIITSNDINTDSNQMMNILDQFNNNNNDNGENIMFLFGSKIMSESYTLKEVKHIIFLTIPDTKAELLQIVARALRSFSYKNIKQTEISIEILASIDINSKFIQSIVNEKDIKISNHSITDSVNKQVINKYIDMLNNDKLEYDLKKMLYLEIKSIRSDTLLKIFKKSHINYNKPIVDELKYIVYIERLKRYFYNNKYIVDIDRLFLYNNTYIIDIILLKKYKNILIKNFIIFYNNDLRLSSMIQLKNKHNILYHIIPIKIQQEEYLMKLSINDLLN